MDWSTILNPPKSSKVSMVKLFGQLKNQSLQNLFIYYVKTWLRTNIIIKKEGSKMNPLPQNSPKQWFFHNIPRIYFSIQLEYCFITNHQVYQKSWICTLTDKTFQKVYFSNKAPLFYQWRRQTWYECHLSFFRLILLNVLPEISKLFLQQLTSLACFELKQYFILFFKNFPNFHFPPLGYLHVKQKITLATKKGNVV